MKDFFYSSQLSVSRVTTPADHWEHCTVFCCTYSFTYVSTHSFIELVIYSPGSKSRTIHTGTYGEISLPVLAPFTPFSTPHTSLTRKFSKVFALINFLCDLYTYHFIH